ncbi:hypothetical protein [Jannaschia seohaensis]|uniref:Uncharacterized protein n=1 Tax=Jannaschia seohaensis TaxID=475081 RepID=A0A2Y9AVW3_9RHOB|nr:hypothetical protein [Jannaschia seohaensis]PWJ18142.1 hypothetical protein BCF38_105130 [Jannaschia seohaensis]SSA46667.1 hypothetical protein SAMN05421539_105130 [Jannaschia seohaensis]
MIPRATVARAIGLPEDTDALPPGDLPLDRFAARYVAYLATEEPQTETPDAWTGAVMDALIAEDPELAFAALRAGLPLDEGGRLADPLSELGARPGWAARIEAAAEDDPALAARLDTGG